MLLNNPRRSRPNYLILSKGDSKYMRTTFSQLIISVSYRSNGDYNHSLAHLPTHHRTNKQTYACIINLQSLTKFAAVMKHLPTSKYTKMSCLKFPTGEVMHNMVNEGLPHNNPIVRMTWSVYFLFQTAERWHNWGSKIQYIDNSDTTTPRSLVLTSEI